MSATYQVVHRTRYEYDDEVSASYGRMHLLPRTTPGQDCDGATLTVDPPPDVVTEHRDYFGNRSSYFEVTVPHRALQVTSTSTVTVHGRSGDHPLSRYDAPWERVRDGLDAGDDDPVAAREFTRPSPLVTASPALSAYAAGSFPAGRPIRACLTDLLTRIHTDFRYEPGVTTVTTTLDEVLRQRRGVCQDFSHLMIGGLRSLGLAARYVSGYVETRPPPGGSRLQGVDASHAWVSVALPGVGWLDLDPTNDQVVDDRYVTTAWGRDYGDVPPLKGVIFTESAESSLQVYVDMVRQD
ncbi:MAG: transglutaminase family protein [Actinomycetota bacterium]|nr:MAG: transglutaminase family protein [Actinomycetota bacterium]